MTTSTVQPQNVIQASQHTVIEYMNGPSAKGPKKCIHCHQTFKVGEAWQRITSPEDQEYGSYAFGIHTRCMK